VTRVVAHINIFEIVYPVTLDMGLLGLLLKLPASKITGSGLPFLG